MNFKIIISILFILLLGILGIDIKHRIEPKVVFIEKEVIPNEYLGEFDCTFYTHTGNNTSTGIYPKAKRTVAVDPKVIPYGTMIYIKDYGFFIAEDCGSDIHKNRLDIFLDTKEECIKHGRKKVQVWKLIH